MQLTILACLLAVFSLSGHAVPLSFQLSEDVAGPTCAHFSGMGPLAWSRRGGDWIDADGRAHGPKAFDTQHVLAGRGRPFAEWNVTELVLGWLNGWFRNDGMLLRAEEGKSDGVIDFHSRETADLTARPTLKLKWSDGSLDRLSPVADTFLDCSTLTSLGTQNILKVSVDQSALLRFSMPTRTATLVQASLLLVSDKQYGKGASIGVFRVAPPYARATNNVVKGLSNGFARDAGIEKHPDVFFATGFESPAWVTEWGDYSPRSNAETVLEDPARHFTAFQGRALRVRLVKGSNYGLDLRYLLARNGKQEPEELYFRYYLRFGDDWNPYLDGGKLPGIAGTYGRAGWGMRKSDGYNGWSVRGGFAARPAVAKSVAGLTSVGSYVYHADAQDSAGDYWGWNEGPAGLLENNKWYAIEQYVKLNSPGHKDGIFRAWIDGLQVVERTGVRFRQVQDLKIESVWFGVYHGGVSPTPKDMSLYIDNVVIAKSYIGPIRQ